MPTNSTMIWYVEGADSTTRVTRSAREHLRDLEATSRIILTSGEKQQEEIIKKTPREGATLVCEITYTERILNGSQKDVDDKILRVDNLIEKVFNLVGSLTDTEMKTSNSGSSEKEDTAGSTPPQSTISPTHASDLLKIQRARRMLKEYKGSQGAMTSHTALGYIREVLGEE